MRVLCFDGGVKDGAVYYKPEEEAEPEASVIIQTESGLHEYRLMDTIADQGTGDKIYKFRFEKKLSIGDRKVEG